MMLRRASLVIISCLVLAACVPAEEFDNPGFVSGDGTVTEWPVEARTQALSLVGTSYTGDAIDVTDYRGQVVIVTTWYAACPPCRAEAPLLVELDAREDVQLLGVNSRDDQGTAQAFQRNFAIEFPSIDDADGRALAQLQGFVALNAVPTTLVIDPQGRVAARILGEASASVLTALVDDAAGQ